jgi:aflatoxin B1 aldehyde reductase
LGTKVGFSFHPQTENSILTVPGAEQARVHSLEEAGKILDTFTSYGHSEIDTARTYGGGSSEEYLGKLDWQKRGIVMDTKFSPNRAEKVDEAAGFVMKHTPEGLREAMKRSLTALKTDKVDMWYLHAPDRSTPYDVTLKVVDELYKEGGFSASNLPPFS